LEQDFKEVLRKCLGEHASILTPEMIEGATEYFETGIKRQFNPSDVDYDAPVIPLFGAADVPEIKLQLGRLHFSKSYPTYWLAD
jgi:hypothetical protein